MARLNTNAELFSHLTQFGLMTDSTGTSTTVQSTAASGATSVTTGSSAFAANDYVRFGYEGGAQIAKVETCSTAGVITTVSGLIEALSTNVPAVVLTRTDLGDLSDDGVQVSVETERTTINAGTQRHAYAHHVAHTDYVVTCALENISWENLLTAMGIGDSNTSGAGTTADPTVSDWDPEIINNSTYPWHFWARGVMKDGTAIEVQFMDADLDPAKQFNLARGQDAPLSITFNPRRIRWIKPV